MESIVKSNVPDALFKSIIKFRTDLLEYSFLLKKHREGLVSKKELEEKKLQRNKSHNNMIAEIINGGFYDDLREPTTRN